MYIVMTGTAGDTAARRFATERAGLLVKRLALSFVQEAAAYEPAPEPAPEGVRREPIGESGVFGALWRLLDAAGLGAECVLADIPLRQETVEICEILGENPYETACSGELFLWDGMPEDVPSGRVIGRTNETNDRIIRTMSGIRYLNRD